MANVVAESQTPDLVQVEVSTDPKGKQPAPHLRFLDGLRALCALYVVIHHWYLQYAMFPEVDRMSKFAKYGHYSVDLFIVISGFCLALPVSKTHDLKGGALEFYKRRAWRILPPYYFALLLSLFLIAVAIGTPTGNLWDRSLPVKWQDVLSHVFLLQDLMVHSHIIDYPMWSISVEWRIYFLFPLLVWLWRKQGWAASFTLAVALSLIYYVVLRKFSVNVVVASPQYILLFAFGMIGSLASFGPKSTREFQIANVICLVLFAVVLKACVHHYKEFLGTGVHYVLLADLIVGALAAATMIIAATNPTSVVTRLLGWKPLAFIGTFAYSIYLIHAPLIQCETLVFHALHFPGVLAYKVGLITTLPVICALAYGFFWFCERPYLKRRPTLATLAKPQQELSKIECGKSI